MHNTIFPHEKFFDKWSNNMAYVLGFVAADGCIRLSHTVRNNKPYTCKSLKISLAINDFEHLDNIRKVIGSPKTVKVYTIKGGFKPGSQYCEMTIYSAYLVNRLIELGIGPKKSLTMDWPPKIPNKYLSHFIRGYLDGDGSIFTYTNGNMSCLEISFIGTDSFIETLKDKININGGSFVNHTSQNMKYLRYRGSNLPVKVGKFIYKNLKDSLKLDRKYTRYKEYLESYNRSGKAKRNIFFFEVESNK